MCLTFADNKAEYCNEQAANLASEYFYSGASFLQVWCGHCFECLCLKLLRKNVNMFLKKTIFSVLHCLIAAVANCFCFSFADRLNASAEHITRYISRDHEIVAGTTYDAVWLLVKRLSNCGLFSSTGAASQIRQNSTDDGS
jgi:hypothetical protein